MTDQQPPRSDRDHELDLRMSRAGLLRGAAGVMLAASPLLAAACGGGSSSSSPGTGGAPSASGNPVPGGTLRAGFVGAGTAETLSPLIGVTPIDQGRIQNLYDPLVLVNADLTTAPGLALEWNANSDATSYEVKLRPDVTFHNGKSFGADDVIYSIQQMAKPATSYAVPFVSGIDLNGLKKVDDLTREDPAEGAGRRPGRQLHALQHVDLPGRRDQLQEPGRHRPVHVRVVHARASRACSRRTRTTGSAGKPYVDELKIISIDDPTARLNALLTGDIDAMAQLPTAQAKAHAQTGDMHVLSGKSPQPMMFYMDTTKAPFNDTGRADGHQADRRPPGAGRRRAERLRQLGNDIVGKGLPWYDDSLPQREQDIDQAKSLLKTAGQENLTVLLQTSQIFPGFVESATLLAEQAKARRRDDEPQAGARRTPTTTPRCCT